MKLTEFFLAELDREAAPTRRVVAEVPALEGRFDWKPHEKSMGLGYLANLVASMPSWITMMIKQDSLDLNPPGGSGYNPPQAHNGADLAQTLDGHVAAAREALEQTTDEHLMTPWRLMVAGNVVLEQLRHVAIQDAFNHLAHHRGQLTVYLRLNGAKVPSVYGPSADDKVF
jgi:uncharacterized damage-inducible protein DinB